MITFVGTGIQQYNQLTLKGLKALQDSKVVLTFEWDEHFFQSHSIQNVFDLRPLYINGAKDEDNYQSIEKFILNSEAKYGEVTVAVPGHPRLGVTILNRLTRRRTIQVIEGISSFCTMINDLDRDPLERGTVLMDANRFLLFDIQTSPFLDHFFYHICSVGTARTNLHEPSQGNSIKLLTEKLTSFFGPEHSVFLISSSTRHGSNSHIQQLHLQDLTQAIHTITFDTTLFAPAKKLQTINRDFLKLIQTEREPAC